MIAVFIKLVPTLAPYAQAENLQIPPVTLSLLQTPSEVPKEQESFKAKTPLWVPQAMTDSNSFKPSMQQETGFHTECRHNAKLSHILPYLGQ